MKMTINTNNLSLSNFNKICRTCLTEGELKPLYESCSSEDCFVEMLMACTLVQFKKKDGLPEQICTNCIKEINQSYNFAKKCEIAYEALRKCIDNEPKKPDKHKIKEENEDILLMKKSKINSSPQTKSPGRSKKHKELINNDTNEQESINIKNEIQLDEIQNLDYEAVKKEDSEYIIEDYIIENSNENDDSDYNDWGDDFPENVDDLPCEKKIRGRRTRNSVKNSVEHEDKNCEEEDEFDNQDDNEDWSDDDFEWNMEHSSDKDGHMKRRRSSRGPPFVCKRCDLSYETYQDLEEHRIKVKHPERKTQPCPECNKFFTSSQLKGHIRTHTKERPFLCSHCGKGFSLNQNLRRHLMIHTGERPHKCHLCEKAFIQQVSLKDHLKTHTGETPYVCSVCGCGFKWQGQLKKHMIARHEEAGDNVIKKDDGGKNGEPEHECPICHRRYNKKAILRTHMLIHGEKKFLCSWCGKGFFSIASLQAHSKVHTGVRPYTCQTCGKTFSHIGSLKSHTLIHTGEKPFACTVCNKAFTQRNHVKYHMRIHTGDRPYVCTVCGKTFALNGNLTVHMRTHTGETPFLCPICGKGFHDSSSMKKHKKGHTGQPAVIKQQTEPQNIIVQQNETIIVHQTDNLQVHQNELQVLQSEIVLN